jgi:hypothetical protein
MEIPSKHSYLLMRVAPALGGGGLNGGQGEWDFAAVGFVVCFWLDWLAESD